MYKNLNKLIFITIFLFSNYCYSYYNNTSNQNIPSILDPNSAHIIAQLGGFYTYQGESQDVGITGLIGDKFNVTKHDNGNILVGFGYFINTYQNNSVKVLLGLNGFYLAKTYVKGEVIQENLFTNLSFKYYVSNYPIYIAARTLLNNSSNDYNIILDFGIGPNFSQTSGITEKSLDGGTSIPDSMFSGKSYTAISATAGFGIKVNNFLNLTPVEIGYRFFYLDKGYLNERSQTVTNNLTTSNSYINALILTFSIY
ncbi:hypothetical protein N9L02_00175 [Gammaproteobacteria bacterium]|nr:hypothetical protein [Gammaproteobacteria bacterium]